MDFTESYEQHVWQVYAYLAYRLSSRVDAEDLTQLTFERAFRSRHRYDPAKGEFSSWVLSIARNALIDHFRRDRSGDTSSISAGDVAESELPRTHGPEADLGLDPEVAAALAELSDRDRELLALRFGADLKAREIADLTGLTSANVHQILSRSLRRLKVILDEQSPERVGAGSGEQG